jgi:hypothetical protein
MLPRLPPLRQHPANTTTSHASQVDHFSLTGKGARQVAQIATYVNDIDIFLTNRYCMLALPTIVDLQLYGRPDIVQLSSSTDCVACHSGMVLCNSAAASNTSNIRNFPREHHLHNTPMLLPQG